jgi:hypothetical protein
LVVKRGDVPTGKIELILVGELSHADRQWIERSPAAPMVKMLGYRSHAESVGWLSSADVLFLPNHTPLDGGPTLVVPGKTYEYLGSARPILAMSPAGDMKDFVTCTRSGAAVEGTDVAGAADALAHFYKSKVRGERPASFDQDRGAVRRFERRELTHALAEALDELVDRRATPPAPAPVLAHP